MAGDDDSNTIYLDKGTSDCGCSGIHERKDFAYMAVAPQTASEFNQLRLPVEAVACWRMDDARFDFDSSFIVPAAQNEFALLREIINENPDAPLSVFGHADPTGTDDYNKKLSGRRAQAVYAALTRDIAAWERLYTNPMQGDKWTAAHLTRMQNALGGSPDTSNRPQLFRAYMDFLCNGAGSAPKDKLELTADRFLAGTAGAKAGGKGNYQGCSRFNPVKVFSSDDDAMYSQQDNHPRRDVANAWNRRVTVFLFAPGTQVDPQKWPCPAAADGVAGCKARFFPDGDSRRFPSASERLYEKTHDTFACRFYQRIVGKSPCEGSGQMVVFRLRLCNFDQDPIAQAPCRVHQAGELFTATADDDGFVVVVARETPETLQVEWTKPDRKGENDYPYKLDVYIGPGSDEAGGMQRLHNVGYSTEQTLEDRVRAYQTEFGRTLTGVLADIQEELTKWHDGGAKPEGQIA